MKMGKQEKNRVLLTSDDLLKNVRNAILTYNARRFRLQRGSLIKLQATTEDSQTTTDESQMITNEPHRLLDTTRTKETYFQPLTIVEKLPNITIVVKLVSGLLQTNHRCVKISLNTKM